MFESLRRFGIDKLGDGPSYGRHTIEKRSLSIFKDVGSVFNPRVVVEVGSWEGASTISWAENSEVVICIDTWLGSVEHYENGMVYRDNKNIFNVSFEGTEWSRDRLFLEDGRPSVYKTFADNIRSYGFQDKVVPISIDSNQAYIILQKAEVNADIVYIDGAHDYFSVMNDLVKSYSIMNDYGHVCGDDYCMEVKNAVDDFCRENNFTQLIKESQFIIFDKNDKNIHRLLDIGWVAPNRAVLL